jgi:hypothetical protein
MASFLIDRLDLRVLGNARASLETRRFDDAAFEADNRRGATI